MTVPYASLKSTPASSADIDQPLLIKELNDEVVTLTLNRPKQFNALSVDMLSALQSELQAIADDDNIRSVVSPSGSW